MDKKQWQKETELCLNPFSIKPSRFFFSRNLNKKTRKCDLFQIV